MFLRNLAKNTPIYLTLTSDLIWSFSVPHPWVWLDHWSRSHRISEKEIKMMIKQNCWKYLRINLQTRCDSSPEMASFQLQCPYHSSQWWDRLGTEFLPADTLEHFNLWEMLQFGRLRPFLWTLDVHIAWFWQVCTSVNSCALFKIYMTTATIPFIYKCHPHMLRLHKIW